MSEEPKADQPLLKLTNSGYWNEIDEFAKDGKIPQELGDILGEIINSHRRKTTPHRATPRLIKMMKQHLSGGVMLTCPEEDRCYDVMIFIPDVGRSELRPFFLLVPKYPGGRLKHLDEI
jgi:hypothetical protein